MSIDIHPEGQRFAVGGQGVDCGRISIWNMKPVIDEDASKDKSIPTLLTQMDHHEGCVNCVRWSNDGKFLASGGDDKLVMIWEKSAYGGGSIFGSGGKVHVENWRLRHTLRGHNGDVLHVAWGPFDNILASASVDNTVMIWNAEKFPELVTTLRGHTGLVKGVVFDPVGKFLASQSDDKTLRIWRTSDWTQETVLEKPFSDSGATTHVLRPDWSADGALLVSAHAMNGGGPTAQIIERIGWKIQRDFVGHRKAVSCVRFNRTMFEKPGLAGPYTMVALGSRDRSISVWSTDLKRPFFVINDIFEQSVLDLAWSKDGKILLACSMDGTVAAIVLDPEEIGSPFSDDRYHEMMLKVYGKNFSKPTITTKSKQNGTVVIENPDILKASALYSNGHTASTPAASAANKTQLIFKGPTDKQIEARASDGRRRITPIFVPPPSIENGTKVITPVVPFGSSEFGSSSTHEKSQIAIEKRDVIVTPNVSPGKQSNDSNSLMTQRCSNSEPMTMTVTTSTAPSPSKPQEVTKTNAEPPVNLIQVKRKPGPAATTVPKESQPPASQPSAQQSKALPQQQQQAKAKDVPKEKDASKKSKEKDSDKLSGKKKRSMVILDSSDDENGSKAKDGTSGSSSDSGSTSSSSSSSDDSDDEKTKQEPEKRTPVDKAAEKLKESKLAKPEIMLKRKANNIEEDKQQPRKRIRPLLQRDLSVDASSPPVTTGLSDSNRADGVPSYPLRRLTPLRAEKSHVYSFNTSSFKLTINVNNYWTSLTGGCCLHQLKCSFQGGVGWETMFSSPICAVANGEKFVVVAGQDGGLHFFSTLTGNKLYPPLVLDSEISRLAVKLSKVAVVTTDARLYAWDLEANKALMRSESIAALLTPSDQAPQNAINISKLTFSESGQLVIVTSAGKSYIFNEMFGTWLRLSDVGSSVQMVSDYATASANLPAETRGLPLASLSYLTPGSVPRLHNISEEICISASVTHCQDQVLSAKYLGSSKEYKFWLMAEIKQLAREGNVKKLRSQLEDLLGPVTAGTSSQWEPKILGLDKRTLLREALRIIAGNLELQRLYSEFNEQLNASSDLMMIDSLLEI